MNLFISGEFDLRNEPNRDEIERRLREARNKFENALNPRIKKIKWKEIDSLALVLMVCPPSEPLLYPERRFYSLKQRAADYRLILNYDNVRSSDENALTRLIADALLRAIDLISKRKQAPKSDNYEELKLIVRDVAAQLTDK